MTIKQNGGVFSRNPTFGNVNVSGALTAGQISAGNLGAAVLADVDLSAVDIRLAESPVVITGVDQYNEIKIDIYVTTSGNMRTAVQTSADGGLNFANGASDYGVTVFNATFQSNNGNQSHLCEIARLPSGGVGFSQTCIRGAGSADIGTIAVSQIGGDNSSTQIGQRRSEEINDAIRIYSDVALTGGRLIVTGVR